MRLVRLTRWDGVPIHVNPSRILYVEPGNVTGDDDWGSVLVFEQTWHPDLCDGRAESCAREQCDWLNAHKAMAR